MEFIMKKFISKVLVALLVFAYAATGLIVSFPKAEEVTSVVMTYEDKVFSRQLYSVDTDKIKEGVVTDGLKSIGELCDNLTFQTNGAVKINKNAVMDTVKNNIIVGQKNIKIDLSQYTPEALATIAPPTSTSVLANAVSNTANAAASTATPAVPNAGDLLVNEALNAIGINYKIAEASTKFNPNQDRAVNVRNAASKINGWILQPGMMMSANFAFTPRTTANGYGMGNVISGGKYVKAIGGGICQVSSTLNLAVLRAGIIPTTRHNHSHRSNYIGSGLDATISGSTLDYQFVNTLAYPIYISAQTNGGVLTVSIYSNANALAGIKYEPKVVGGALSNQTYLIGTFNGMEVSNRYCYSSRYKE